MDANAYKIAKSSPGALDFGTLDVTQKCLSTIGELQIAQSIARILANNKIDKPIGHNKAAEQHTSYYHVDLPREDLEVIVAMLLDKEVNALSTDFETTPAASLYATLLDAWSNLMSWRSGRDASASSA